MITVPLPVHVRLTRNFHVALAARQRYDVHESIVDLRGRVMVVDAAAAERLAARINGVRDARRQPGVGVSGAEIVAAALLDEAIHLLLDAYRRLHDPAWSANLDRLLTDRLGSARVLAARTAFVSTFPPHAVMRGEIGAADWMEGRVDDLPAREVAIEERIAVRLANENPALERLRELVDDADLGEDDRAATELLEQRLADLPGLPGMAEDDLWSLLRGPMRASPTSLEGQLAYVREHWGKHLGDAFSGLLARLERSLDLLAELRAGGQPGPPGPAPVLNPRDLMRGGDEPEAYSPDADWMPSVVLVAKNAYVWLDQLSRWTGREIRTLDRIPDEVLAELRAHGFRGLWLIGLWERSEASARIKRMRGQEDAVASAYSLYDYRIADDLGGYDAWQRLRDQAARHDLRLAADMVPNHVGIDGRWVIERPDYFLDLPEPPYPGYSFGGANLSSDDRVEIRIEDGYWESRDAAVVFERLDRVSGERRYVYHGNDGTSMPWNDTAQIDYLNPDAREAVIQVILEVARMFPIIRFDAAMTLAKKHVQRLWYPPPGQGGAIPSRSTYGAIDEGEFERRMPVEFWREVVDRVAQEAPNTLLLAEAFWMMEGFFVRTLGMHRVYNSAFMNMLAREANEDYQTLMRNVLEFDPQILARFVNFMNNPDEETAIAQFGDGDKAYGVATLMATLPGLPMFGHGQVEGLHEKYGMEYRRAKVDERPDERMIERHRRDIAPLLARRAAFAGTDRFRLFEVDGEHGPLHDVFAYANGLAGGAMNLVVYHNRYADAHGRIRRTVPFAQAGETRQQGVGEALGLQGGHDRFVRYRDLASRMEYVARTDGWLSDGIPVHLGAYQRRVLVDLVEVRDVDGRLARLHDRIGDDGVDDLDEALIEQDLQPLHQAFVAAVVPAEPTSNEGRVDVEAASNAVDGTDRAAASDARHRPTPDRVDSATADETGDRAAGSRPRATEPAARADAASEDGSEVASSTATRASSAQRELRAFVRSVDDYDGEVRFDRKRAADYLLPIESSSAGKVPGVGWRRAFALACGFEHPADAARRFRLEGVVARRVVPSDEPAGATGVSADTWAALWRTMLPTSTGRRRSKPVEDPDVTVANALASVDDDPALRTLLGVHEHDGVRWYRQEGFQAWRDAWLATHEILVGDSVDLRALRRAFDARERASAFRFDRLLERPTPASSRSDADPTNAASATQVDVAGPGEPVDDEQGTKRAIERDDDSA